MKKDINWDQILDDFNHSIGKESVQAFCSRKNINAKELEIKFNSRKNKLKCVDLASSSRKTAFNYLVIDINGMKVRVGKDFDQEHLASILKVMKSIC